MPSQRPLGIILLAWVLLLPLSGIADEGLRARLEQLQGQGKPGSTGVLPESARLLDDFYARRDHDYAWNDNRQVTALLDLARQSVDDGFPPDDFHVQAIADSVGSRNPSDLPASERIEVEILLSDSLLRLLHYHRYGKVDPQRLDKRWGHKAAPYAHDLVDDLERAVPARNLQAAVAGPVSRSAFYTRLRQGLARYRGIAAGGGWPRIPAGQSLKPGMTDSRAPVIRERLRATGDFDGPASDSTSYDQTLQDAVLAFQKRHHLATDAVVGPRTLTAMNVSAEERVDRIRANLERMRWVSEKFPDDFLLVDIPGQQLRLYRNRQVVWDTRVIVGKPKRPTPAFRDRLEYLEINPTWTVPPTILKKDILPAVRRNRGYLKRKGLQVVTRGGKRVSPGSVNWNVSAARFPYMIRQRPGPRNALGRVKFMFPNKYSVYLHDTPSRGLFNRSERLRSSGCVRVQHPWKLAELVLDNPEWNQARFQKMVASKRNRRVNLEEPLDIVLAYWTATGDTDGKVEFRRDVYGRDADLLKALDGPARPLRILYPEPEPPATAVSVPPEEQKVAAPDEGTRDPDRPGPSDQGYRLRAPTPPKEETPRILDNVFGADLP